MNPEGRKRDATAGAKLWTSTDSGATWTEGLEIARKRLTGVIAPVGRGKSILLAELQTEAQREAGSVWARGDRSRVHDSPTQLAYCSQQPFIMQATVKENIVCDRPWSATRYRLAIESCALLEDIQSFGNKGDETEIGENGLNLSRGQKARISLARAVYANADVYLLDFSAMKVNVAEILMEKCVLGVLRNKTRVVVAQHPHLLDLMDRIVVVQDSPGAERLGCPVP